MKSLYSILLILSLLSALCWLTACSGDSKRSDQELTEELSTASRLANSQALRLSGEAEPDSSEMEAVLIEVRVCESKLRENGEDRIADHFVSTFLAVLDSVNPSLREEISTR